MNIYDIKVEKMNGETILLNEFKGKTLLIVNTASKCGFTKQFAGLENLYKTYKDKDFIILGFPCNQFLRQDPGTNDEILGFCQLNFGVTFPMFSKINVNGKNRSEFYQHLIENSPVKQGDKIKWNFEKFLINKEGVIINRFPSKVTPGEIRMNIEEIL